MGRKKKTELEEQMSLSEQISLSMDGGAGVSTALAEMMGHVDSEIESKKNRTGLLDDKKQVVMSNKFVVSKEEGSVFAYRISRIAISQITMDATELPMTVITADDIEAMGMTRQRLTGHVSAVLDEILSYRVKIASWDALRKEKHLAGINVFSQAHVIPGKGAIAVQLNSALKQHFLHLQSGFTQYPQSIIPALPGTIAPKLHEILLSQSRAFGTQLLRYSIADLEMLLTQKNVVKSEKRRPSSFINNSIKRAVENINKYTECEVAYLPLRTGREYTDVRFYVDSSFTTLDEKMKYLAWRKEKDPEAEEDIMKLLRSGTGEINASIKN